MNYSIFLSITSLIVLNRLIILLFYMYIKFYYIILINIPFKLSPVISIMLPLSSWQFTILFSIRKIVSFIDQFFLLIIWYKYTIVNTKQFTLLYLYRILKAYKLTFLLEFEFTSYTHKYTHTALFWNGLKRLITVWYEK